MRKLQVEPNVTKCAWHLGVERACYTNRVLESESEDFTGLDQGFKVHTHSVVTS